VLLVLGGAPEEIVERAKRIDLGVGDRIAIDASPVILEQIAFIVWTRLSPSCQYDQINSTRGTPHVRANSSHCACG
jgi:hypothetical protein